jgi:PTS system nitrogen regulatory IIA component
VPHRTLNIEEVSVYLHMSKADLEALVRRREIPHERQGNRLVFRKKQIEAWASQRLLGLSQSDLSDFHKRASVKAHDLSDTHALIPELMKPEGIEPRLTARTKSSVVRQMVKLAERTGLLIYPDDLLKELEEREKMCSTALAGGIALLHPRHHEPYMFEDSFVVLGRVTSPVFFGAPDGSTTDLFFLVCSQEERIHLHVLARLCMICYHTQAVMALREAADAAEMHRRLVEAEREIIRLL